MSQRMKKIMEECKEKARAAGLEFHGETLEYIITNQEHAELEAKLMIPSLYDYWVHDVEVVRNKWLYDVYPHNPYESTINTRPAISFYNDNNPDWLNAMIFYHVLGHIDMSQNNIFFRKTWDDDFYGQALADKRLLNKIREERGAEKRWVDYVVEFSRSIDNLVGYYAELEEDEDAQLGKAFGISSERANFYFGAFLKERYGQKVIGLKFYYDELDRYNQYVEQFGEKVGEEAFFGDYQLNNRFPEFQSAFKKYKEKKSGKPKDILQYLMEHSEFLNKDGNEWMKDVMQIVRRTSLFIQPIIRTKICHEGWASLWHERLFVEDLGGIPSYDVPADIETRVRSGEETDLYELIKGREVGFAAVNSRVLLDPRIGLNVYAVGKHLFEFIENMAEKGRLSYEYQMLRDAEARKRFDRKLGRNYAKQFLFEFREKVNDAMLVNFLSDEDFQDFVDTYQLFVAGVRITSETLKTGFADIYIKSKSGKDFRRLLNRSLYHPPHVIIREEKSRGGELYLDHQYEGRVLVKEYIPAVLIGLAYLWGGKVKLETTEWIVDKDKKEQPKTPPSLIGPQAKPKQTTKYYEEEEYRLRRVLYTCEGRKVERGVLS